METVELKLKLVENEEAYRNRFYKFVQVLKMTADDTDFFKQTKTKTIMKISEEVLKSSDDLLLILDNRKRISQQGEAIYKVFEEHHVHTVDILSVYCSNLTDIRSLLLSSLTAHCNEVKLSRMLNEALLPVHHVEELLLLLQEIKAHLDAKRRLVEIFSCNSLIDQLTKGSIRIRRVLEGLNAEELLLTLQEMSINGNANLPSRATVSLAEDDNASNPEKLPKTFISYAEIRPPTASNGNKIKLEGKLDTVVQVDEDSPVSADETAQSPVLSEDTGFGVDEGRFEIHHEVFPYALLVDADKVEPLSKESTSQTDLTPATESNGHEKEDEGQNDFVNKKKDQCLRSVDNDTHCSSQSQNTEIPTVTLKQFDFPTLEIQPKRKPPIPSPRTRSTINSVQSVSSLECDFSKSKITETVLLRRESKKLIRHEVETISSQISQLKTDISSLEKKIVILESTESSENSECSGTDDHDVEVGTGEYPEVFDERENAVSCSQNFAADCSGVILRSSSVHYDAGLRSRRTKHLLHSTIWQVPLYQEYHVEMTSKISASDSVPRAHEETQDGAKGIANSLDGDSRPESGIELEGDGDVDEPVESYYTPMWNNGSRLVERVCKSTEYASMEGVRHSDRCAYLQLGPKHSENAWDFDETKYSCASRGSLMCHYETMERTYENMRFECTNESQEESVYSSVHDIFGAVQIEKESADQVFHREEVGGMAPSMRMKQKPGWCNIPVVKESGILEKMTKREMHLHEAKYELISSQVSFLKSLSVLQAIFISNMHLKSLMSTLEWDNLFQYIRPIKTCSEHFLADLLSGWPQDMFMSNQLLVVRQYALSGLQTYVNYCSNKVTMDKTLSEIRANKPKINNVLKKLESDEICDNNTLESFLVLPIQRITRFPLLVEGILCRMDSNTDKDFCDWAKTYREFVQMAQRCNDAVRQSEEPTEIRQAEVVCKTIPDRNQVSSPLRKSSKSTTLPKRKKSAIWHDSKY